MVDAGVPWTKVARVEKDAIGTILALLADDRVQIGEAALPVFEWREPGVEIVGVEDRERSYFGCEMEGKEEDDGQGCVYSDVAFSFIVGDGSVLHREFTKTYR